MTERHVLVIDDKADFDGFSSSSLSLVLQLRCDIVVIGKENFYICADMTKLSN